MQQPIIYIVNFNTTSLTNALIESIRQHMSNCIIVFDNSNMIKFTTKHSDIKIIDNTKQQLVEFEKDLQILKKKYKIDQNSAQTQDAIEKYDRMIPYLAFLNCPLINALNLNFYDPSRLHFISVFNEQYDTGGSFLEDVLNNSYAYGTFKYKNYINHIGGASKTYSLFKYNRI